MLVPFKCIGVLLRCVGMAVLTFQGCMFEGLCFLVLCWLISTREYCRSSGKVLLSLRPRGLNYCHETCC